MKWIKLDIQLPENDFVGMVIVNGHKRCLIQHHREIYLIQNTCPHAGGLLSGGWCENDHIVCPIHRWSYHLKTGRGAEGQGDAIDIYPVEKRTDGVYVGIKESLWKRLFGSSG